MSSASSPGFTLAVPPAVRWIVSTLEEAGYETWTVGGAVRDALAGRPSGDWDLTTRAEPAEVRRIFRRTVPVGVEHGTVGVLARDGTMYEVTTFRRDVETFGRHAVVAFAETLLEDLERRDFTINAMAWHPLREELCDPHGGADDLGRGLLRTVGRPADRFAEDYLRILRAFRFAGRYGLQMDPATWSAARDAAHHLTELSPERVREELWKTLGGNPAPGGALELYRRSGTLGVLYPELARWAGAPDEDPSPTWLETLSVVEAVPVHRPGLRLAALLGPTGEPVIVPDDPAIPHDAGPAPGAVRVRAMVRAAALLTRLRHSNAQIAQISGWVGAGPDLPPADASDADLRRYLARVERDRLVPLVRWSVARTRAGVPGAASAGELVRSWSRLRRVLRSGVALTVGELELNGRDLIRLGLRPGPHFGRILEALLERVLDDPSANDPDKLASWAREMAEEFV